MTDDISPVALSLGTGRIYSPNDPVNVPPAAKFISWEDFIEKTPMSEIRAWCSMKAGRANRKRLLSAAPTVRLKSVDVLGVLMNARGRCHYCGSLCVEKRPSGPLGEPMAWANVGRRIGTLGHIYGRISGGDNHLDNLVWECLWCNTWPSERRKGATDHGAL